MLSYYSNITLSISIIYFFKVMDKLFYFVQKIKSSLKFPTLQLLYKCSLQLSEEENFTSLSAECPWKGSFMLCQDPDVF